MSFFRTVSGDINSSEMGITYSHEHIVIENSFVTSQNPDFLINDTTKIIQELKEIHTLGCQTMIDTMPLNAGRNVLKMKEIAEQTGIHIVMSTGLHLEKYYPTDHWRYSISTDDLVDIFVKEIQVGIDEHDYTQTPLKRSATKAGLIKLATGDNAITAHQEKIFEAVTAAHIQTGVPILTHTNEGALALEQAHRLAKLGADLKHVVISHVDRNKDTVYIKDLLQTGVSVEFDSAFRAPGYKNQWTYSLLERFLPEFPNQITVGMDAARNTYWKSFGGKPGLAYLLTTFTGILTEMNLESYFENIFIINPKRIFSFKQT